MYFLIFLIMHMISLEREKKKGASGKDEQLTREALSTERGWSTGTVPSCSGSFHDAEQVRNHCSTDVDAQQGEKAASLSASRLLRLRVSCTLGLKETTTPEQSSGSPHHFYPAIHSPQST